MIENSNLSLVSRGVRILLLASSFAPLTMIQPAYAQEVAGASAKAPSGNAIEEIVITAERREESLQKTPIAVTALSAEDLKSQNVSSFEDIAKSVPGLSISSASTTAPSAALPVVFIRGIGQQDPSIFQDPGVGIYVDGVYVARSAGSAIDLPDIGRVEVLRGPQGTLFGKNAVGGALNIVTQTPSAVPTANLDLTAGNYNLASLRGVVSGPLADTVRGSIAFNLRREDGYEDRLAYPDQHKIGSQGDQNHQALRALLRLEPISDVTVNLSADYTRYRDTTAPGVATLYPPTAVYTMWNALVATPGGFPWTAANSQTGDQYKTYANGPNFADDEIWGTSASVSWKMPWATLKSITAYRHVSEAYSRDSDGSPAPFFFATGFHQLKQFSQEFQLLGDSFGGRLDWLGGLYYLRETGSQQDLAVIAPGLFTATKNAALELGRLYSVDVTTDSYAAYGQTTYHVTDQLGATLGLRYTSEKKSDLVSALGTESGTLYVPPTSLSKTFDATTPKFGLQYQLQDDILLYASATKGFKSGGFNGRAARPAALTTFDPETVWSYEAGVKSEFFDQRLRLNLAAYYMDYKNIQLAYFILTPQGVVNAVANVAASQLSGVEAEATVVPFKGLELTASGSYNQNDYKDIQPGAQVSPGNKLPFSPAWTASASAQYRINLSNGAQLTPRLDYSYRSSTYAVINNTPPSFLPAYGLLNGRITYTPASGPWSLSAYGTNLANRYYVVSAQDNTTASLLYQLLGRPREYGVTLNLTY